MAVPSNKFWKANQVLIFWELMDDIHGKSQDLSAIVIYCVYLFSLEELQQNKRAPKKAWANVVLGSEATV